ncbi:hypothetical protein [Arthrobacter sp. Soil763]|uniref:hypothetical protein n=1 Tax=Arthrobacter sp. Soil763 TaxID=1736402 RepID=UPI000700A8A4|nr:hypothetical protein [Arthrobacter sp. Soil763]KRE79373.1 hypothetical protein ASG71_04570 [Arthrobacter sp. Soil763]
MSSKPIEPEDIVNDGVDEDAKPVPREESGPAEASTPSPAGQEGHAPGEGDSHKVPGPAEEDDEKSADDRGLTTDTSPD